METFVAYVAKHLAQKPECVSVRVEEAREGVRIVHLGLAAEDMGKVIGKHGEIADAMRVLLQTMTSKKYPHVRLHIEEKTCE